MISYSKNLILSVGILSTFFLVSCGPKSPEKKEELLGTQPEELTPSETQGLTLPQQEKLEIDEDNVMNPIPG